MKIERATFIGVLGVPDLTLDLVDAGTGVPHTLVVIAGPSGSGKTRMLEALMAAKEAIRPYGPMATGAPWIRAGNAAKILVTFHLDEAEREFAGTASQTLEDGGDLRPRPGERRGGRGPARGARAVFAQREPRQGRLLPGGEADPDVSPFRRPRQRRAARRPPGKDPRKYGFVLPFLRSLGHDVARRERFAASLAALSPTCRLVDDTSGDAIPRCFSSRGGDPVTVAQLSHGESDAVIFAATAATIGLDHSLVFVDRPDLHLDDVEPFIEGLAALGQDNQLLLTARRELAAAARRAHVVTLKSA